MENKIQELTEKIYREGVEKGNEEAQRLVSNAREEAAKILEEARKEAEAIVATAHKSAKETAEKFESIVVKIYMAAGADNKFFGSVTNKEIADCVPSRKGNRPEEAMESKRE